MNMRMLGAGLLVALAALAPRAAHAQTPAITVTYPVGLNMVGAPAGTDLSGLGALYSWTGTQYVLTTNTTATLCTGYWARPTAPTTIRLAGPPAGATQACPLQGGWNLIGNPFTAPATLPPDALAYEATPGTGSYSQVHSILEGGAAWVYAQTASALTLTGPQSAVPPPATVLINTTTPLGSYTVHVGERVELLNNAAYPASATEDGRFLHLLSAGQTGDADCGTQAQCNFNLADQFWLYEAIAAGQTSIRIDPMCTFGQKNCSPSYSIPVTILPNS